MLDFSHQPSPKQREKALPKRIILVRHGESAGNIDGTAYATTPDNKIPLTPQGIDQARQAGERIFDVVSDGGACSNWKVYFYVSPYLRTRSTLREIGRAFPKNRIIGAREECRVREQDFGNFQVAERMKVIKETRERFGRFFYRFPEGESAADVFDRVSSFLESLWRDIDMNRLNCNACDELNLVIISHGLAIRVFLMKWFKWTVEQFEYLNNLGNCEFRIMQLGTGGEYSLAVHHTDEEMHEWGLSPEMIADQRWRANATRGDWNDNCPWYLDTFFDKFADSNREDDGGCLSGNSLGSMPQPKLRGVQVQLQVPVQVFTLKEAELATNKFSESTIIESGASGVVYRGVLRDGTAAAIKMLRANGRSGERAFRLEVDLLSRLRSPYISELLGYCADQHHRLLVFEYMPNGSLEKHLHPRSNQCGTLNWGTRLKIALDCARALEYLHEHMTPSIIHRDFKCSNILLDQNFRAKLSGFGLAKIGSDKLNGLISTRVLGTTGYLAPEYASTGKLTTKSDVYSYGVILLELLTGRVPIDTTRSPGEHVLVSWALPRLTNREKVIEMIDPALNGQYSNKDLVQVAAIAAMCVQTEADYRPLITDVVQSLMPLVKNHSVPCSSNSLKFSHSPSPRR